MIPIYEQGTGRGIGLNIESFTSRLEEISIGHIKSGRAKSVAFILYDFSNKDFKNILKDQGVFTRLDRLSGNKTSIFYIHSGSDRTLSNFNKILEEKLGIENARKPCIVFCRADTKGLSKISIKNLDHSNLIHGFSELYDTIEQHINEQDQKPANRDWISGSIQHLSLDMIKDLIKELLKAGLF